VIVSPAGWVISGPMVSVQAAELVVVVRMGVQTSVLPANRFAIVKTAPAGVVATTVTGSNRELETVSLSVPLPGALGISVCSTTIDDPVGHPAGLTATTNPVRVVAVGLMEAGQVGELDVTMTGGVAVTSSALPDTVTRMPSFGRALLLNGPIVCVQAIALTRVVQVLVLLL
jgi:hypothetical protein